MLSARLPGRAERHGIGAYTPCPVSASRTPVERSQVKTVQSAPLTNLQSAHPGSRLFPTERKPFWLAFPGRPLDRARRGPPAKPVVVAAGPLSPGKRP
jgi:hypothetical protein